MACVFWVHASSHPRIEDAYRDIAWKLAIPGRDDPKSDIIQLVSEYLTNMKEQWLLVLDNADNTETFVSEQGTGSIDRAQEKTTPLGKILPHTNGNGSIPITTRDAELGQILSHYEQPIYIPPMPIVDAKHMIIYKIAGNASDIEIEKLVMELNCLPLALMQAAAHISKSHTTVAEYLALLCENDKILDRDYCASGQHYFSDGCPGSTEAPRIVVP